MDHPRHIEGPHRYARREFLKRAAAAGIAIPSLGAILAACGGGAQTGVGGGSTASGAAGANPYGTGGIAGAPYPLARPETGIDGLYLGSASVHPGPGVHGGPGWIAAGLALRDRSRA